MILGKCPHENFYYEINENGRQEIKEFLERFGKTGLIRTDKAAIDYCAEKVWESLGNGAGGGFELHAHESKSGHVECFSISPEGFDKEHFFCEDCEEKK